MIDIAAFIKKMLTQGLTTSEKIQLSEEKPLKELMLHQWEEKSDSHIQEKVDADLIWKKIKVACWENDNRNTGKSIGKARFIQISSAVAAVAIILLIGVWMAHWMTDSYVTMSAPTDKEIACVLPDKSTVWVNAGSTIRYKKNFKKDRKILLEGEAFFEVVKMPESPFRVYFNEACVEVKGTVFTIKSNRATSEVILFSGKVAFTAPEAEDAIEMQPSDRIVYDAASQKVSFMQVDTMEYDWRTSEYRFTDKPLGELIDFLNRTYKVNIILTNKECEKSNFSGIIYKNEPLKDVLDKVCFTFDMQLEQTGQTYILH